MLKTFLATINPMLTMFFCMVIGFALKKCRILPDNASKTVAKLLTWVACPALSFSVMARYFTISTISKYLSIIIMGTICVTMAIIAAFVIAPIIIRKKSYERCIYRYAMAFANSGYMGEPLVQSIFGDFVLSYYKLATLPISIAIYAWGVGTLVPSGNKKESFFKKMMNPPLVSMIVGMIVGIVCGLIAKNVPDGSTAYDVIFPSFIVNSLDSLKACMGPIAMILAGITVANYDFLGMFKKKKVYVATALRLIVLPTILLASLFGIKELCNLIFGLSISNTPIFLLFFATATPLGLNTVVFPEAYEADPEIGASMAMLSHTLCVISIPLMYSLLTLIIGDPVLPV
ncbi:MAG: AEC family transporter [Clostridia bacterium]|nr:AEC family transporter [Clostridia bacterium]